MDTFDYSKTISTCLATDSLIIDPSLREAKNYLGTNFASRYVKTPHVTYMICPFSESNSDNFIKDLENLLPDLKSYDVHLGNLKYDEKKRFFSIPLLGSELMNMHIEMLELSNKYRDGYFREKDVEKIRTGGYTQAEMANIQKYGYARVLDLFSPQITIGNIEIENTDTNAVLKTLNEILANVINKTVRVNQMRALLYNDAKSQNDMTEFWIKEYELN